MPAPTLESNSGPSTRTAGPINPWSVLCVGLALSIGWGIRGNYGHEYGAMIPGALASMAAVLLAGREDWHRRIAYFGFFGALGWSFGGSISYMQVIGYCHSAHSGSVLYGFACLYLIGFLWAALGGAGAALPAFLDRPRLTGFFVPLAVLFAAWTLQDWVVTAWFPDDSDYRHRNPLYWFDTDWLAAAVAILSILGLAAVRRRIDFASSLILHLAVGWWAGFLILVNLLGWRMTPPRGDNWAGCVGMVLALFVFLQRRGLAGVTFVSLVTGFVGGFGFATGNLLKLAGVATGWQTNWHSVLEQTYGFINGIGLALALFWIARFAPPVSDEPRIRRGTGACAAFFVLVVISYLNLAKNPARWVDAKAVPEVLYGLSAMTWFNLAYAALAVLTAAVLLRHARKPLPLFSGGPQANGQWLCLLLLWCMVLGNFERAVVSFAPARLVTEGVIFLNAVLCTAGVLLAAPAPGPEPAGHAARFRPPIRKAVLAGLALMLVSVLADWGGKHALFGNSFAGHAGRHVRFGPDATATTAKPGPGAPHP